MAAVIAIGANKTAVAVLRHNENKEECMLDLSVTYINLAQLCMAKEDYEAIDGYVKKAEEILDGSLERNYYYAHTAEKISGGFGYLGYFMKDAELKERAKEIYERN